MKFIVLIAGLFSTTVFADWQYKNQVDPMTDIDSSFVLKKSESGNGSVIIRCSKDDFDIIFRFNYVSGDDRYISLRFDQNKPKLVDTTSSTDRQGRFVRDSQISPKNEILKSIESANKLVARSKDWQGTPNTEIYNLIGSKAALSNLTCLR